MEENQSTTSFNNQNFSQNNQNIPFQPSVPQPPPPPAEPPVIPTSSNVPPPPVQPSTVSLEPPPKNHFKTFFYLLTILILLTTAIALGIIIIKSINLKISQPRQPNIIEPQETIIPSPTPEEEVNSDLKSLENQSSSDEIKDIEKDLQNTDFTNLEKEISSISSEIEND